MVSGLIFLALLLLQNPFSTQVSPEHIVKQFTIADGLPLNAVLQVVQAEDGFLYMATFDGLVRFDGYEFITFNKLNSEGLSSTRLMSVGIDSENLIWVASPYGNLSSFDGFTFANHDQTNLSELPLFTGFDGIGEQVALLGSAKGRAIPFLQEHTLTVNESRILIDSTFVRIGGNVVLDNEELRGGFEDAEGTIWVYTRNNGLFQIKESKVRNFSSGSGISFSNTYEVIEPQAGEIWIKGFPFFNLRFNASTQTLANYDIINDERRNLQFLFSDPLDGSVFGYSEAIGLWKIEEDRWIRENWFTHLFDENERPSIQATHRTRDGHFFVGTSDGLIVDTADAVFWVKNKTAHTFRWVRTIAEAEDGSLWMGTNGFGMYRLNPADWSFQHFTVEDGLGSNFIRDIHLAAADTLWLATQDRGLNRIILGSDGTFSSSASILPSDGLLNHGLHRIIPDQFGYLWVNSNGGIMRFKAENLNAYASGGTNHLHILKLTEEQGLINNEGNGGVDNAGLMLQNGLIVFPNQAGVAIINPQDFITLKTERLNRPVIDKFTFNNQSLHAGLFQEIVLPLGERDFRVSFTLPNFSNPDLITFSYRLEGLHNNWRNPVSGRTAVFTNVPAGEYRFQVRAAGPDGTFQTVSLPVVVPPHFYETIWFFILCILLGLITIGILHRSRTKTLRLREMRTRSLLELQTCYVIRTDLAGNYTYANPKFIEVFGFLYKNNESRTIDYLGRNCLSSISPEDQQKVRDTITDLLANPYKVIQVDMRKPLKDGTKAFTLWDFSVVFGLNNKPAEIQCVGIDYTERKKQEKQLKESEHKLQRTIESVPHPMLIVDENLSIQFVNEEFQRVFGYAESEILGESAVKLLPVSSNSDQIKRLWNRIRSQENVKRIGGFQAVLSKNGNEIAVFMSLNHFSSGGRKSTIIILQDVTELKIQQDVILKQNKTLREIAWHQSHVVRRPVANILGLIDFITSYPEETLHQQKELLEMLKTSVLELDEIVKDMVRMSNDSEFPADS